MTHVFAFWRPVVSLEGVKPPNQKSLPPSTVVVIRQLFSLLMQVTLMHLVRMKIHLMLTGFTPGASNRIVEVQPLDMEENSSNLMNSVMESLYFGVLVVVVPQMIEQRVTAQPCTELGLGIALDSRDLTAEKLLASWRMTTGFGLQQDGISASCVSTCIPLY